MSARALVMPFVAAMLCLPIEAQPADRNGHVVITVSNDDGSLVAGLTTDDFAVAIDGHGEEIASLSATPMPLSIVVILDQSASMISQLAGRITDEIDSELAKVLRPGDSVRFASASGVASLGPPTGVSQRELKSAIGKLPKPMEFGASPIWDSVSQSAGALAGATGRHLLILVTEGRGTGNRFSAEEAASAAAVNWAAVSVVDEGANNIVRQDNTNAVAVRASPVLEWLSRITGGSYYQDPFALARARRPSVETLVARAVVDQRTHYVLTVAVPDDRKFHDLRVRPLGSGRTVHAPGVIRADPK